MVLRYDFTPFIATQRSECSPEKTVLRDQVSKNDEKTWKRENRVLRVFLKLRKWSLSLNPGVKSLIIDYWFLVKLHRFGSVSKKVIFTISFFTRPVFPSVFENWKTRKTRFPTWRHLRTSGFWPFLALFCTFLTFRFKNMKTRVFSCFYAFFWVF